MVALLLARPWSRYAPPPGWRLRHAGNGSIYESTPRAHRERAPQTPGRWMYATGVRGCRRLGRRGQNGYMMPLRREVPHLLNSKD
jgi:hypothetical protein